MIEMLQLKHLKLSEILCLDTETFKKYEPEEYRPGSHITRQMRN